MATLLSLSDDLLRRVADFLPQRDAVALSSASRHFDACCPTHVTRAFAPDAAVDEYVAMFEWIVKHRVASFTLAVDASSWNAARNTLVGTRFDRVTIVPNEYSISNASSTIWIPECNSFLNGFVTDDRLSFSSYRTNQRFSQKRVRYFTRKGNEMDRSIDVRHLTSDRNPDLVRLPHFATVPGSERIGSVTCAGPVEGIDGLPLDVEEIVIEKSPLRQADIDRLSRFEGWLRIARCTIDASVTPRSYISRELSVTIDALRVISDAACAVLVLEMRGDEAQVDAESLPSFPNVTHLVIAGYCHDRMRAFRISSLFPNALCKFEAHAYDPL